jgi:hypothetical protein
VRRAIVGGVLQAPHSGMAITVPWSSEADGTISLPRRRVPR